MGNIGISIKRFLGNKNTVTILGVLIGIGVIYFGYNWRVNQAIEPQTVPFAKVEILGNELITDDKIGTVKVSKNMVETNDNLITNQSQVIGKYVRYDTTIPKGGLFYSSQLMLEEELPNSVIKDIPEGYTLYSLAVDLHSTYGNSIMPDDYIDLYFKAVNDNNFVMLGKFMESIKVLAVKDSAGEHVFSSSSDGEPAELLFAVPDNYYLLLRKAGFISTNNIEIIPVPRNKDYSENPTDTVITSEEIKAFINSKAVDARQNVGTNPIDTEPVVEETE